MTFVKRCNRNKTRNRFRDKTFQVAKFDNVEPDLATQNVLSRDRFPALFLLLLFPILIDKCDIQIYGHKADCR